jgi:type 1 glutamine amidotransferase/HEAT repeat protein
MQEIRIMRSTSRLLAAGAAFVALMAAGAFAATEAAPLRVLILSGRNNHDWRATTPALKKIYEAGGRFSVDVTEDPSRLDAAMLAKYDAVVSNWSGFPDMDQRQWGPNAEKAFADFIRGGKGFAAFHAASACLRTWPEFCRLIGAVWGRDTGHGAYHAFKVTIADREHPVTRGMKDFVITDELWHRMQGHPDRRVLCTAFSAKETGGSGQDEPVVLCTALDKGRGFNLVLGHDARTMQNVAWQTLMLRGTEWAARGEVTIPIPASWPSSAGGAEAPPAPAANPEAALAALNQARIAAYRFGDSREGLATVERLTRSAAGDPALRKSLAAAMTRMLASEATVDGKRFLCGQLSLIGSQEEVPALAALLADKDLAMDARAALARIPGEAALAAMRAAAEKASGSTLIGLINTLGERRDAKAVEIISRRLSGADAAAAGAAVDALAKIGGADAAKALSAAAGRLPAELQPALANAMVLAAESLLAAGNAAEAAAIYKDMSAPDKPKHVRMAAFPGLVACQKDKAAALLKEALSSEDPAIQSAAIRCARGFGDGALTAVLAEQLPKMPAVVQVKMLAALADRGDPSALAAVTAATKSGDPAVQMAALAALGALGNADTVAYLAGWAAESSGADRLVAHASLVRLRGDDIEPALIRLVREGAPAIRRAAIAALQARVARAAVPALIQAAEGADRSVAEEALKALAGLADAKDCASLVALFKKPASAAVRPAIEGALVAVIRRTGSSDATVASAAAAMAGAETATRASLVRVIGRVGGAAALAAVRDALKDPDAEVRDAAIRALAEWQDASALPELLEVARSARGAQPKALALRGFARLAAEAKDRPPEQLAPMMADAMKLAERPEERKALLGAMAKVPTLQTMNLAAAELKDAALAGEAALAAVQIADTIWRYHPDDAKAVLQKVMDAVDAPAVKQGVAAIMVAMTKPPNLAIGATATNPDGLDKDGAAGGNQAAIDGNPDTYWDEVDNQPLYRLKVTLRQPAEVSAISILGYQHHQYAPKDFEVLCDDKAVKTVRGAVYDNNRLIVTFPMVRCTALELKIGGYYGASPAIRELEIYRVDPSQVAGPAKR